MANYREIISKRECLVNAVLWSVIPALQIGLLLFFPDRLSGNMFWWYVALLLLQSLSCAFHWRRWLAYDKSPRND